MPTPEVLEGPRAPRAVRLEEAKARAEAGVAASIPAIGAPPGVNVYIARDRRYRVQITAPRTLVLSDGRKQEGGKMIVAQFEEGVYRNDHRDPEVRKLIDEELQRNKYFGRFGDGAIHFWLASEQNKAMEQGRIQAALATLKSLPKEAVDQFIGQLAATEAEDHTIDTTSPTK